MGNVCFHWCGNYLNTPSDFNVELSVCLSVCRSGLRVPIAYSLLGGGVPIPEQRICWNLDSVPLIFKNHYIVLDLGPHPMELVLRPTPLCSTGAA